MKKPIVAASRRKGPNTQHALLAAMPSPSIVAYNDFISKDTNHQVPIFSLKNLKWLLIGVGLAVVVVWFWPDDSPQEASLEIPIKLESLPENLMLTGPPLKNLTATIRGPRSALANLASLKPVYAVDLAGAHAGKHTIPVHPEQVHLPKGLTVISIDSSAIHLVLDTVTQKEVPIVVALTGRPAKGYSVTAAVATPAKIVLRGPQSLLNGLTKVMTNPIDVSGIMETLKKEVAVSLEDQIQIVFPKGVVTAQIQVEEKVVTRKFNDIPVEGINAAYLFSITPPVIQIEVKGPVNVLDKLMEREDFSVHVDLEGLEPGVYVRRATIALPLNTTLVGVEPEIFTLNVIKP